MEEDPVVGFCMQRSLNEEAMGKLMELEPELQQRVMKTYTSPMNLAEEQASKRFIMFLENVQKNTASRFPKLARVGAPGAKPQTPGMVTTQSVQEPAADAGEEAAAEGGESEAAAIVPPTDEELSEFVVKFGLSEDSQSKLLSLAPEAQRVIIVQFNPPEGLTDVQGKFLAFAASIERAYESGQLRAPGSGKGRKGAGGKGKSQGWAFQKGSSKGGWDKGGWGAWSAPWSSKGDWGKKGSAPPWGKDGGKDWGKGKAAAAPWSSFFSGGKDWGKGSGAADWGKSASWGSGKGGDWSKGGGKMALGDAWGASKGKPAWGGDSWGGGKDAGWGSKGGKFGGKDDWGAQKRGFPGGGETGPPAKRFNSGAAPDTTTFIQKWGLNDDAAAKLLNLEPAVQAAVLRDFAPKGTPFGDGGWSGKFIVFSSQVQRNMSGKGGKGKGYW